MLLFIVSIVPEPTGLITVDSEHVVSYFWSINYVMFL